MFVCTTAKSSIHAVQASTSRSTRPSARAQRDGTSTDLSSPNACDVISFAKSDPDLNRGTTIRFPSPGPRPGKAGLGRFILGQWSHQSTRGPRWVSVGGPISALSSSLNVAKSEKLKNKNVWVFTADAARFMSTQDAPSSGRPQSIVTPITQLLGIQYPVILAGMNLASGPRLAAA